MKTTLQRFMFWLTLAVVFQTLTPAAWAESRGKALKRAEKELRQANFEEAEKIYRQLLQENGQDKDARLGLSLVLTKRAKYQESFEEAAQVITADPSNARAHALMGTALLRSGEFRNSIESLYTAVKFNNRESIRSEEHTSEL